MNYCKLQITDFDLVTAKQKLSPVVKKPIIFCYDYCSHLFITDYVDIHPEKTIQIIYCIFCEKNII